MHLRQQNSQRKLLTGCGVFGKLGPMNSFSPLSDGIVDSSIWEEPDHVFRVFIGLLSIRGTGDMVLLDSYKLHRRFHMDHGLVMDALKVLSSPDAKRSGQPHEGRRIAAVDGGWLILNAEEYREKAKLIAKRARDARAQANYRAKKAGKPLPYPRRTRDISPEELDAAHSAVQTSVRESARAEAQQRIAVQHLDDLQWEPDQENDPQPKP